MSKEIKSHKEDPASQTRRRLLKLGAYVPPAIIGMAIISGLPGTSHAKQTVTNQGSCKPSACRPCVTLATSPQLTAKELKKLQGQCLTVQKTFK